MDIEPDILNLVTNEQAWHYEIIPCQELDNVIKVLASTKPDDLTLQELEFLFEKGVAVSLIEETELKTYLSKFYRRNNRIQSIDFGSLSSEGFLEAVLKEGLELDASDIHIETYESKARVRMRIDGILIERHPLPKDQYPALINKIKIMAALDISEKRLPQDGRIHAKQLGGFADIRVSVIPTLHGEKIVLRYLKSDASHLTLENIGLTYAAYHKAIQKPNGIILVSGPTGSGKTTSLYATLKLLNEEKRNILTIEDPIEYTLPGINQVQLKESIGLSFSVALKSFLRQDPDVIMVGEIRDSETAEMAIRAALTGHLVFSTIHTNSAIGTIDRLIDMGVPPFLVSNTLNLSVAQRLVRTLCPHCKKESPVASVNEALTDMGLSPNHLGQGKIFEPVGCHECHFTGYAGRKAVYEIMEVGPEETRAIKSGTTEEIHSKLELNKSLLWHEALRLVTDGYTSLTEVTPLILEGIK